MADDQPSKKRAYNYAVLALVAGLMMVMLVRGYAEAGEPAQPAAREQPPQP